MSTHFVSSNQAAPSVIKTETGACVTVTPLGSGQEVGRSCVIVSYAGKSVMFDCGLHPARSSYQSLPLFDEYDLSTVDLCLITHFHLDHCGALPYLCEQTNFKGRVFMTHPTHSFFALVIGDLIKIGSPGTSDVARSEWLASTLQRVERTSYHSTHTVGGGIRFTALNAGHVLGAAMFLIEIAGIKILYTGDYSRLPDRHLLAAELPPVSPDILIVESTYGILEHKSVEAREKQFVETARDVVKGNGRCLVPVFAFGRAQELLLILEEYWEQHQELQSIPIYFASSVAGSCIGQYKTFAATSCNDRVQKQLERHVNPFDFKHVRFLTDMRSFEDNGPCVVLASPGMLQSGLSRQLFERWCNFRQNGVILAGYAVEGTIADDVRRGKKQIDVEDGRVLNMNMGHMAEVSFSAHADVKQTTDFIHSLPGCRNVVLVHGNPFAMSNLQKRLEETFHARGLVVHAPKTGGSVSIRFERQRAATLLGGLASKVMQARQYQQGSSTMTLKVVDEDGHNSNNSSGSKSNNNNVIAIVEGLSVQAEDHQLAIVAPGEVSSFSDVQLCRDFQQAVVLPLATYRTANEIARLLNSYFEASAPLQFWEHSIDLVQQRQEEEQRAQEGGQEKPGGDDGGKKKRGSSSSHLATEKSASVIAGVVDVGEDAQLAARIPLLGSGGGAGGCGAEDAGGDSSSSAASSATNISVVRIGRDVRAIIHENPIEGKTTVTVRWRSHTKSDLIADIVVAGLLICDSTGNSAGHQLQQQQLALNMPGGTPAGTGGGGGGGGAKDRMTPAESDSLIFRYQCFHRMLRQHFPCVSVNLSDGTAIVVATAQLDGRQVSWPIEVRDWVVPRVLHPAAASKSSGAVRGRDAREHDDDPDAEGEEDCERSSATALPPLPDTLKRKIGFTLQRIYLAINPIPFDDVLGAAASISGESEQLIENGGWCGCGATH